MNFLVLFVLFCSVSFAKQEPLYTVEIVDTDCNVTRTNNFDFECKLSRISRGIFGISVIFDYKEDINTDNVTSSVNVYYSSNDMYYTLSPFRILPMTFTDFLNFGYKDYMMDEMKECCENPTYFEGKFVSPLTKRRSVCTNCSFPSENLPSYLRPGYYKIVLTVSGEINFSWMQLIKVVKN